MINPYFTYEVGDIDNEKIVIHTNQIRVIFLHLDDLSLYVIAGFNV